LRSNGCLGGVIPDVETDHQSCWGTVCKPHLGVSCLEEHMPLFSTVVARKENDVPRVSFLRVPDCGSFHVTLWGTGALATFLSAYFVYLFLFKANG